MFPDRSDITNGPAGPFFVGCFHGRCAWSGLETANRILSNQFLTDNLDAAFWRVIVGADLGNWPEAYLWIKRGQSVIGAYPAPYQHRFQLAAIAVALNQGDRGLANKLLSEIDPSELHDRRLAEYLILRGEVANAAGNHDQAIRSFENARRINHPLTNAKADLMLLKHRFEQGVVDADVLIPALASLNMRWRGDETERDGLRLLSRLHSERGAFREAFQVMKTAVLTDQKSNASRILQDEIASQFEALFLHGETSQLPPIEALALYYDFRELTPIGVKGDEVIRKLAARLVDVDLLPQAIQLLSYQVDNRLTGAARAQIAADLAFVYLLNKQPNLALQAIRRSHQAGCRAGLSARDACWRQKLCLTWESLIWQLN